MANILLSSDLTTWYKRLNFARTQSGVGLSSVTDSSTSKTETSSRVKTLVNGIKSARTGNERLAEADDTTVLSNFDSSKKINISDKESIDSSIISLLRVCPNMTCQTQCTNTIADTNGVHMQGTNENGTNTDQLDKFVPNTVNWDMNGDWGQTDRSNAMFNGYDSQGGSWTYHTNGVCSQGTKENGEIITGNTNQYYDPATATYTVKDFYSEEEALARVK
jgi:hypothetical protein